MAFHFRLQKVLDHRRRIEDEAKRDYLTAQAKTALSLKELEDLYVAIDIARNRADEGIVQTRNLSNSMSNQQIRTNQKLTPTLQHTDLFINGQKIRIEHQRAKIRELKAEEERLQDILIQAARETKTLEKLREKHLKEFREEQLRREQSELDDMAVMRYGRGEGP